MVTEQTVFTSYERISPYNISLKRVIWHVYTIHLLCTMLGILMGTVVLFSRSLGKFAATISFVANIPNQARTIPRAIYNLDQHDAEYYVLY